MCQKEKKSTKSRQVTTCDAELDMIIWTHFEEIWRSKRSYLGIQKLKGTVKILQYLRIIQNLNTSYPKTLKID